MLTVVLFLCFKQSGYCSENLYTCYHETVVFREAQILVFLFENGLKPSLKEAIDSLSKELYTHFSVIAHCWLVSGSGGTVRFCFYKLKAFYKIKLENEIHG